MSAIGQNLEKLTGQDWDQIQRIRKGMIRQGECVILYFERPYTESLYDPELVPPYWPVCGASLIQK